MSAPIPQPPVTPGSPRRIEDEPLITGRGRFVGDLAPSGEVPGPVLHAAFARSPLAHARIEAVDVSEAREMPGVVAVWTSSDLDVGRIPGRSLTVDAAGMERPVLADDVVRHVGEPIAVVIASTAARAVDAADRIWPDLEPLPVVTTAEDAATDSVVLHPAAGTNVVESVSSETEGDPPIGPVQVTVEVVNGRIAPNSIEPLGILAVPDGAGLTVYCGHQAPHRLRDQLAPLLGVAPERLRVIVPDVGGAFGMKGLLYPEYAVVASAALTLGRPVQWTQTRREHFVMGTHGRGQHHRLTLTGDRDGRILAADVEVLAEVGAYPHNGSHVMRFSRFLATGLYDIPHLSVRSTTTVSNLAPTGPYRGAGRPEAAYAIERAVDAYARAVGLDPFEMRARNLIGSLPHVTPTGALYDSGDYVAALERVRDLVDPAAVRIEQRRRLEAGEAPLGLGVAAYVERAGGSVDTGEYAAAVLDPEGRLEVRTGSTSAGQGHSTVWAQVAASAFGVTPDRVTVVAGDTGLVARGTGTAASRSTMLGASAVWRVTDRLAERSRRLAADLLEASPADIVIGNGGPTVAGSPTSVVTWERLAAAARAEGEPLFAEEWYVPGAQTFPYGVHAAIVSVEAATGSVTLLRMVVVDDVGNVINPMIVEGQTHGSVVQGIGQALLERIVYDPDGQPLTASLLDYSLPVATDIPDLIVDRMTSPAPSNALGAKGAGEGGCIGAPPAIVNAVLDALDPFGVTHIDMPLTPFRVWEALQRAGDAR